MAGNFWPLAPGQCVHRSVGKAYDVAGVCLADLVGFVSRGYGHDDQVADGALDQGRARAGFVLADDQVAFPATRDFPTNAVGALIS